jgi:hypothetical protein
MPVHPDNIDEERRERLRRQGRERQARHAARKKAEKAASLRPRPQDVDKEMLRALLDFTCLDAVQRKARHQIVKHVYAQAVSGLTAGGYSGAAEAVVDRCRDLQTVAPLPPVPKPPSSEVETTSEISTPGGTPVTTTDANSSPLDRIADPTHA